MRSGIESHISSSELRRPLPELSPRAWRFGPTIKSPVIVNTADVALRPIVRKLEYGLFTAQDGHINLQQILGSQINKT